MRIFQHKVELILLKHQILETNLQRNMYYLEGRIHNQNFGVQGEIKLLVISLNLKVHA